MIVSDLRFHVIGMDAPFLCHRTGLTIISIYLHEQWGTRGKDVCMSNILQNMKIYLLVIHFFISQSFTSNLL